MPEQLTRHPDVTLQVLRSAGARCGEGAPQEILTACPRERFCRLPGGEVCVYGLPEGRQMTQITRADWAALAPPQTPPPDASWQVAAALAAGIALGAVAALFWRRRPRARS